MINRWVEDDGLLDTLEGLGVGSIAFSPLAQGMLTDKYLGGIPEDSRAAQGKSLRRPSSTTQTIANIRALNEIAKRRGQTLAQMALAWVLRRGRVTTALIGASRPEQVEDCVGALKNRDFSDAELAEIDQYAREAASICGRRSAERAGPGAQEIGAEAPVTKSSTRSCRASTPIRRSAGSARTTTSPPRPSSGIPACRSTIRPTW